MRHKFTEQVADVEAEKNFELARILIDDLVQLDMNIEYPCQGSELKVVKYKHGSRVTEVKLGFVTLYRAPHEREHVDDGRGDKSEPTYYLDLKNEATVTSFLSEVPRLTKYLAGIQDQRYRRVISALVPFHFNFDGQRV